MKYERKIPIDLYAESPPRAEYELTETGCSLMPIIRMMDEWGAQAQLPVQ